ncbi:transcriptional regulator [Nonomuraea sp. NPDC001636]|uniref:transcriptional regulator n=1 Tax=Nonomuraea sp. NPDC001636 TaxID=3154391 RepID=UPI0033214C1F
MTRQSAPDLLALHAVRVTGFADTPVLARRYALGVAETEEELLDAEARGWVSRSEFAGTGGWSLTEAGRAEDERRLAAELDQAGCGEEVRDVHREFLPLNALLLKACTDWQLRPDGRDRLAANDHSDPAWDARILHELSVVGRALQPLADRLTGVLARFGGYDTRFAAALARARNGEGAWVDRTDVDSCHRVWFELHEDLISTLGLDRHAHS